MKFSSIDPWMRANSLQVVSLALVSALGCTQAGGESNVAKAAAIERPAIEADVQLAPFQAELLDLAFEAVSGMPDNPHGKNRARAQELVATAAFDLGQPGRALGYVERIDNWRRGSGFARFALACAERGRLDEARDYVERADAVAREVDGPNAQDWQRERVIDGASLARAAIGKAETNSAAASSPPDLATIESSLSNLNTTLSAGDLDDSRAEFGACVAQYELCRSRSDLRERLREGIESALAKVPLTMRIEIGIDLAKAALATSDSTEALRFVNEARARLDGATWTLDFEIPLAARIAGVRHQAGDRETAREEADAAAHLFASRRSQLADVFRAGALRPLAEAYADMSDTQAALETYRQVVDEGSSNPNARPRAEDLAATACSMALHRVEPDDALWRELRGIRSGLTAPW